MGMINLKWLHSLLGLYTESGQMRLGFCMQVPLQWREDPRWRGHSGGGSRRQPAHRAEYPSRWIPLRRHSRPYCGDDCGQAEGEVVIIDHLVVPRQRPTQKLSAGKV